MVDYLLNYLFQIEYRFNKNKQILLGLSLLLSTTPFYGAQISCDKLNPKFSVEEVHAKNLLQDAELYASNEINFGYSNEKVWCKLPGGFLKEVLSVEYPLLDDLQLHTLKGGIWKTQQWGDLFPRDSEFFSPYLYFLTKDNIASTAVYLSVQSKSSLRVPLYAFSLEQYVQRINTLNMFYSGFFGIVFIMGFFALAMSFTLGKDITYFLYSLCLFSVSFSYLNIFTGYVNLQLLTKYVVYLQSVPAYAACATTYFTIIFFLRYVNLEKNSSSYRSWLVLSYGQLLFIISFMFLPYQVAIKLALLSAISSSLSCIIHLSLISNNNQRARFFFISWVAFLVGAVYFTFATLGFIKSTAVTEFGMQLGTLFQVFFLAVGLNSKIREIHDEKQELSQHVAESFLEIKSLDKKLAKSKESEAKYGKLIKDLSEEYAETADKLDSAKAEQEQVRKELAEASRQLIQAEKLSGLGAMVSGIAHDINNPLNFIETARFQEQEKLDQLKEHLLSLVPEGEEGEEFKIDLLSRFEKLSKLNEQIKTGVSRVTEISKSMRNASRSDIKQTPDVNLVEVIQESLVITGNKVNQFQINNNMPDGIALATCNRSQIGQVVMNFLSNAADALLEYKQQHNGHKGIIQVDLAINNQKKDQNEPKTVQISVSDNGGGVPQENREKVLEAFFTTKATGVGTGLGLAICGKIAQAHNGSITIDDGLENGQGGHGARFTLEFPG